MNSKTMVYTILLHVYMETCLKERIPYVLWAVQ